MALIKVKDTQGNWTVSPIIAKQDVYSTDEQEIGTWIDGKPLYRKVFTGNTPSTTGTHSFATNITNLKSLVNLYGTIQSGSYIMLFPHITGGGDIIKMYSTKNGETYYLEIPLSDYTNKPYVVVYEYTKTTD